eukprot:6654844-Pyramimonas_sp.AAC.1
MSPGLPPNPSRREERTIEGLGARLLLLRILRNSVYAHWSSPASLPPWRPPSPARFLLVFRPRQRREGRWGVG